MKSLVQLAWMAMVSLVGCKTTGGTGSQTNAIFGGDDRKEIHVFSGALRAVGRLSIDGDIGHNNCGSALIGPNLVVTALHCVIDARKGKVASKIYFDLNYNNGSSVKRVSTTAEHVYSGSDFGSNEDAFDWAIIKFDDIVSDYYLPLGTPKVGDEIVNVGYSKDIKGGEVASADSGCSVRAVEAGIVYNDCDIADGASGGPLISNGALVGINVSGFIKNFDEYTEQNANYASASSNFLAGLSKASGGPHIAIDPVYPWQPRPAIDPVYPVSPRPAIDPVEVRPTAEQTAHRLRIEKERAAFKHFYEVEHPANLKKIDNLLEEIRRTQEDIRILQSRLKGSGT